GLLVTRTCDGIPELFLGLFAPAFSHEYPTLEPQDLGEPHPLPPFLDLVQAFVQQAEAGLDVALTRSRFGERRFQVRKVEVAAGVAPAFDATLQQADRL